MELWYGIRNVLGCTAAAEVIGVRREVEVKGDGIEDEEKDDEF